MDDNLDYPLAGDSIVVEVGGWRGEWASRIAGLYDPYVYVYEPIREYYEACRSRFRSNAKVTVIYRGLGASDSEAVISKMEEASSAFLDVTTVEGQKFRNGPDIREPVRLLDAAEALGGPVDLLSLNCEGAEFAILPRLIESGSIVNCRHVQVQFHKFYPQAERLRDDICGLLAATHAESWCTYFGWESWRLR